MNSLENGKIKHYLFHRIIAEFHLGPCPKDKEVDHIDGNKLNNNIENLRYVTHRENMQSANFAIGSRNPSTKITDIEVLEIRNLATKGMTQREIAEMYNVSHNAIGKILRNITHRNI